ncbi:hypothetical protein V3W47_05895 [Deinococcus sp. YIM 134068]|uniref:hypothetical protein n=1 Tax=Deinococcus lichenicola TaxID=3118910 RepID=UPI002F9207C1
MTVEGQRGESELLVDTLRDEGRDGYFYYTKSRLVQARMVSDRFIVEQNDDGTPAFLTIIRFDLEASGTAPRTCAVPRPVRVAPGEALQGIYMNGKVDSYRLSSAVVPSKEALAVNVRCTLTRVK